MELKNEIASGSYASIYNTNNDNEIVKLINKDKTLLGCPCLTEMSISSSNKPPSIIHMK